MASFSRERLKGEKGGSRLPLFPFLGFFVKSVGERGGKAKRDFKASLRNLYDAPLPFLFRLPMSDLSSNFPFLSPLPTSLPDFSFLSFLFLHFTWDDGRGRDLLPPLLPCQCNPTLFYKAMTCTRKREEVGIVCTLGKNLKS